MPAVSPSVLLKEAMREPVERRLTAILAADVVAYSRLMGADEEGTLQRLKGARRHLFDPKIKDHRGRIVKTTGDGILAEFPSVVDAVRCAVELQRAMVDRNAHSPEEWRLVFRVGINLGDIIDDGDDIYGDGVNIAARLEALAEPGGICISRVVRDQIRDKLPYPFEDMGEQNVKNIARPVRAYGMSAAAVASTPLFTTKALPQPASQALRRQWAFILVAIIAVTGIGTGGWWLWPNPDPITGSVQTLSATGTQSSPPVAGAEAKPAPRLSIVVLPFINLSNDSEQEYFADAITEDLTTDLSRITGSFVIAATTAFTYKGKGLGAKQIGRELGVRYILEGSVQRRSRYAQVNVQLIDAESGAHLWADRFESDLTKLANAQNEITGRLARSLNLELTEAVGRRVEREGSGNPGAQDFLMRGWASYYRPASTASRQEALRAFERALETDPQSVEARIGIGTVLVDDLVLRFSNDRERDTARADEMLREALEREMNDSMAHFAMGMLRRIQNRLSDSQIELEAAIAFDRNNARALQQLGVTLICLGEPEDAIPQIERAIRLNPHDPNIASYYWALGSADLVSGRTDDAASLLSKARAANPRLYFIHLWLAGALALKGDLDAARSAVAASVKLRPEINSVASWRAENLFYTNPRFTALAEKTLYAGLHRAGFPDE
jgi:adenylate cyclase